ncbi:uncharacterized protein MYCFIDRAFT_81910 [Pseudocercospora fijiensis CIRAD86]|uniref:F-box domain-containing protein n=1 Tax=Pseudocercospora fijiensis (strain CIRAD86) TaxID=383855 RepID=M2Z841_PSEFD|nr:uncharacterized protein MYCFIDRAFT_81910 [Pseudocercospora fijiensis CIRAD86]EME85945.1 hypothetical protein MYCFIDRAFT_81910 [Pseudocercospora fijiensis CIRAD86]
MAHADIVSTLNLFNLPYDPEFDEEQEWTPEEFKWFFRLVDLRLNAHLATLYHPKTPPPQGRKNIFSLRKEELVHIYYFTPISALLSLRLVSKRFEKSATARLECLDVFPDICRKDGWRAAYDRQNDV